MGLLGDVLSLGAVALVTLVSYWSSRDSPLPPSQSVTWWPKGRGKVDRLCVFGLMTVSPRFLVYRVTTGEILDAETRLWARDPCFGVEILPLLFRLWRLCLVPFDPS